MENNNEYDDLALLSISKAAKIMKVGKTRIYKMIENKEIGVIEFNNLVRIPYIELKRWQENKIKQSTIFKKPNEFGLVTRNFTIDPKDIMRGIKKARIKNEE